MQEIDNLIIPIDQQFRRTAFFLVFLSEGRGRSDNDLRYATQTFCDARHFISEAELPTLVILVDHQQANAGEFEVAFIDMIEQTPGSGNHDMGSQLAQATMLFHRGTSPIKRHGAHNGRLLTKHTFHLYGKFTSGNDYNGLQRVDFFFNTFNEWQ